MIRRLGIGFCLALSGCIFDSDESDASKEQVEAALAACNVQIRDFARDRVLNGRYLIMYHTGEPDHERKMQCVNAHLEAQGVGATSIYPEPKNREGLY